MSAGKRLPDEKRKHLLQVYLGQGFQVGALLALEYGVSEKFCSRLARQNGHFGNHERGGVGRYPRTGGTRRDKRWQWAIERGSIIA